MTVVLDALMALAWVFERQRADDVLRADRLLSACGQEPWWVPSVWHLEVISALVVAERPGLISESITDTFLGRLSVLPILSDPHPIAERRGHVRALARKQELTAYDAAYLELAVRLDAGLASFDARLNQAAQSLGTPLVP